MRRGHSVAPGPAAVQPQPLARDEAVLLRRVADCDARAFEALYRLYYPRLARFVAAMARKPELVEEVIDDTMMAIWRKPDAYNGESKVSTWIFAIAYRKALKALRRLDEPMEDTGAETRPSQEAGPEQRLDQLQVHDILVRAMESLSPDHRAVVNLTYFHDLGYREIAEIMSCPVDTVRTRMFHARKRLKSVLSGELTDWL